MEEQQGLFRRVQLPGQEGHHASEDATTVTD